jgi:tetraacyldisaccharide 4'-kinase
MSKESILNKLWYSGGTYLWPLFPLTWLYRYIVETKRKRFLTQITSSYKASCPIVVVGNLTVGGTGKTPLTLHLIKLLQSKGYRPAIVSRGYKSDAPEYPFMVEADSPAAMSGDEPLMLRQLSGVPVCIDANRPNALKALVARDDIDVIISDDGLQHYAMDRDIECVVVDGERGFGNGYCLPVGPLREPIERLSGDEMIVVNGDGEWVDRLNGHSMHLVPSAFVNIKTGLTKPLNFFNNKNAYVYAAIGNPGRFYRELEEKGIHAIVIDLPDHHHYSESDFDAVPADGLIIMTQKDAVKCKSIADERFWCLPVTAQLPENFNQEFIARIKNIINDLQKIEA